VTLRSTDIVATHVLVPEQAPDQPVNVEPLLGAAVSVTVVLAANALAHVVPQSIPAGLLVTAPLPVPAFVTVSVFGGTTVNVAVTLRSTDVVATHVLVPEQAPDQPVNVEPLLGAAVSVTVVLAANALAHVVPQSIPAGLLVTAPLPVPALATVSVFGFETVKIASTVSTWAPPPDSSITALIV
jgi:hypothetical protein